MVRETRYLLIGNLPENVTEEEISEYFKRFSKIQSVRIHGKTRESDEFVCATVAFADIKSASKAYSADNSIRGRVLTSSYSEGSATGSVVKRTLDEPRPSFSANRPSSFPRKGPEDGEVYEGRDYYSAQYTGYTEEYQRGRSRDRFSRGGFKHIDRGGHHQWTAGQRRFGEGHRSNSSSDRDAFEKPRAPLSPARSTSQTSRKSPKMKRKQSNSTSRSRSGSSDSSSSSSYSDTSSDSSRSRSRSESSHRASRSKLPSMGSQVKSGRSRSQGSIGSENTETTEGGNNPHGIRITNLPSRSSDTSLRDGLFHEYKKYGKVNAVQISGNGDGRFAIVSFKKSEDARKALAASQEKRFFGTNIRVVEHEGIDVDDAEFRPPEAELDEHHPKATRTLFVGNLEKEITMEELKVMFSKFGEILDIDVKRQGAISAYSFIQFTDIRSVVKALRALDGETMGGMKLKLGFGKSMPTNCVWVDNLADSVQENFLFRQFARYGPLTNMVIDRERGKALVFYSSLENAQFALGEMRNRILNGQKIQIDFASRDCQSDFYEKMEKSGQLKPGQRSSNHTAVYQRQSSDGQWTERGGRGKFPFPRGNRGFVHGSRGQRRVAGSGRGYGKEYTSEEYRRQRSYDEYSQGGGTPYSEGDFESDLHAYRTQRERQRSCSPEQYNDDVYSESYREYKAARYAEYTAGSPGSEPEEGYYESRDKMYYKERYVAGSREASPEVTFPGNRSWSHSPSRSRVKDPERNTPPTPLGGEDTQDFSSREHSPSEMDRSYSDKRSGKDDFDITEEDIKELRTSKHSAHRKEGLIRSEERYARKRSYEDSFTRDSLSKEEANVRKIDRQLSHGSLSDSKRELINRMKKLQTEGVKSEGQLSSGSSDSGSLTGGDLSKLKHERQMLLEKIKMCEDTNNSDTDNLELELLKKSKRSRLDPWSKGQAGQRLQSELGNVILGAKKDKSYDVSQSYRKQMEALRKNEERTLKDDVKSKKNDIFGYEEQEKNDLLPQGLVSPKDLPLGFVKKRRKTDLSEDIKSRTYRHKRENEDERMSSDNEESAKTVLRTDSVGSIGSIRHLSSAHSSPRTPIGHLSLENLENKLSESEQSNPESGSVTFKKMDSSKRRSKDDLHSSPLIIPLGDDVLVTELHDPRVPKDYRDEVCLPLPKFAEYTPPIKFNSPRSDNSGSIKEDSPCFSPPSSGSKNESPHSSPNDTNSEGSGSQTNSNQEQAYIPPEDTSNNSNEPILETPEENPGMEVDKNPQEGEIDDVLSDSSEHNDDFSLAERIRQLDEKLKQLPTTQPSKLSTDTISSASSMSIGITSTATPPSNIYKSKYKIKKRQDSAGIMPDETEKGEKPSSEIVKTMLNRSSIFDLDSKRLEQINEKYSPNVKSVVPGSEDSSKNVTLRTKAEAKEMPLSTLPGSLAGRLGNGGSSFPTLSINTQPINVKVDDKNSPPLSQEQKTADMCSFNNDNRIYNVSDRMDLSNSVTSNYSPRFNSIDNGLNKVSVNSVIESADKPDIHTAVDSAVKSDPRLNSKNTVYRSDKTADENLDLNNKKLDNCIDNRICHSSPKLSENSNKSDNLDLNHGNNSGNKVIKSDLTNEIMDTSAPVSLGKRKSELNSKKDKVKSTDSNSLTDSEKDLPKSNVKSGSESPDTKKAKLGTPEKDKSDKSETDSPTHSDSAKTDKLKKDNDKKSKDSKKKEKSECDSMNKDKGFNDKKDKDHDGDKGKSSGKPSDSDNKVDEKSTKILPDVTKKDASASKPDPEKSEQTPTKKDNEKKIEHSSSKKEKKSDGSKKSSEGKSESSHKKESKSSNVKDKSRSSHKTKDSSKNKDDKTSAKDVKSSSKVNKTASTEKADHTKSSEGKDVKSSDSGEKKDAENKTAEKSHDVPKESSSDSTKEKSADVTKKCTSSSSEKTKLSVDKAEKSKSDGSKVTDSKHKKKTESSEQHKTKSESSKKDKPTDKTKHSKPKDKSSESSKAKEKTTDSKQAASDKISEKTGDADVNETKMPESADKTKPTDDSPNTTKVKDKSESGKQKDKSGNGSSQKSKEKSEHEKTKSTDPAVKAKTKHSDSSHSKSKVKDDKPKSQSSALHGDKTKDKSHKDSSKKDDDQSKADSKKENNGENKTSNSSTSSSSSSSKQASETTNTSEKKESSSNGSENKSDSKSEGKPENKNDSKSESSSGNTDSMAKNSGKSELKKESKKSDTSKSSSKISSKKTNEKKSESRSSEKKKKDKDRESRKEEKSSPKEEKTSPKEEKSKKKDQKKEVEFDWSAWMDEPYTSMYDRVKRKSSEKDKEREMQVIQKKFTNLSKSRGGKKHSKFSDSDDSDYSHDSAEETDAFEEEKVAKPSKEVSSTHDSVHKRKRCVIDTSTSSDDDDSQFYKSFHQNAFGTKDKDKSSGKTNKHSVNDIYSSDSSETDIDFPPISPAKKKTKKTKKTKKPVVNHDSDSENEHSKEKQKKRKAVTPKPKSKNTPKKKSESKAPPVVTNTDTHESDLYDVDSGDMDRFDRIKLKNQKKLVQPRTPKRGGRLETTTDDSDVTFSPSRKSLQIKKEPKPVKKNILSDTLFDTDSDSSFPDLSLVKNSVTKKNHTVESKKPSVTLGTGVIAQTIRNEDLGEKKDEARKKDKMKKKPKKPEVKSDSEKKGDNSTKSLFSKVENFVLEPKDKTAKHSKKEGKSAKDLDYLDEEEISQAEKLVNNMSKLEKPMKHESNKSNKSSKHDNDKVSSKGKSPKFEHTFSSEVDTDKDVKGTHAMSNHVTKSTNHKKDVEEKKTEDSKPKSTKTKKKKDNNNAAIEKIIADIVDKKDVTEANKKLNNKLESHDIQTKKKPIKNETEEPVVKKPTSKLDMDDCFMKKHMNRADKEESYKLGFGFFNDFPMLEGSKLDEINKKNDKKKKKEKEDETKPPKKEAVKQEARTPKKKDKKKKEELGIKENGPKLEDLVGKLTNVAPNSDGKLTNVAHNSDVFDFQDEEDDNKPLFADFFKKKEEMNKIAGGKKGDGKNSEKRLSSEEKSDDASSEDHEEHEEGHKLGHKVKVEKPKSEDKKVDTEKSEDSIKTSLFSPTCDIKLEESTISSMFSPKRVKEACKDETKNILAFASPKGIDMKSDDEGCKSSSLSPTKLDLLSPKDRFKKDLIVGHAEMEHNVLDVKSKVEEKQDGAMKDIEKKVDIINDKTKPKLDQKENQRNGKKKEDKPEKPELPEKSREEIVEEAVSALQKFSEHSTPRTQDGDTYSEGDLVIDETNVAVETVAEEPIVEEQAQNETDLAILSILPMDGESHQYTEPIQEQPAVVQPPVQAENVLVDVDQVTSDTNPLDSSLGENDLVIDTSAPSDSETPKEEIVVPPPVEKPVEVKEKQPKARRNQRAKDQAEANVKKEVKVPEVKDNQALNSHPEIHPGLPQPVVQQGFMYGQVPDPKQTVGKIVTDVQRNEPYKKTRKQKAASKANHQVEVPGTFYPPVYNAMDHGGSMVNNIQGGDASEKENEEKMAQPYNSDVDKHEDLDNLRVSGDEGSSADKRTRRGRKQQNYKELNSGLHGRNTSPRSRSSPRSPRTGMSPRQALSPLSSPKSDLSSAPFVKIERLPFGCNKNIRNDGELSNDAVDGKIVDAVENLPEQHIITNTKKLVEDLVKPPVKEGTSVFDFDDTEPELKIDTTLKPTRQKKGRRNTQDANLSLKVTPPDVKTPNSSQNHIISPLESRWQCKKDSETEKPGNHPPLKLTIALAHSTSPTTSITNTISNVVNSATIIDSTIPSIKNKKEPETVAKTTIPSVTSFVDSIVSMVNKTAITTVAPSGVNKPMSNVDKIIDDVAKGVLNIVKPPEQAENNDHSVHQAMHGFNPKLAEMGEIPMQMQPSKRRHVAQHNGVQDMMPPPNMTIPPGHDFVPPPKSSPNLINPVVSSPFGSVVMSLPQAQPLPMVPVTTVTSSSALPVGTTSISTAGLGQIGEPQVMSFSQAPRGVTQLTSPKPKQLDMALNMTLKSDSVTSAAHSLSTAAVVTQTTTTTMAQHSSGPSVVMSTQKPMVTSSGGNTTVLAGRTVTVKPPNTEAYLHQIGIPPGVIPSQAHQPVPRMPDNKTGFPAGFMPNAAFSRPEIPPEHSRPSQGTPSDKQMAVTSSAPTCVVHPITSSKGGVDPQLMHQHIMQAVSGQPGAMSTTSSGHPIPPAHMQPSQAQMLEKEQLRNIAAMHGQPMMHLIGQPPHGMPNHIQHKVEKPSKGRQSQKSEILQPNDPMQRPPSAHSQKPSISESPRPHSAHNNIREMLAKGMIPQEMLSNGPLSQEILSKGFLPQEFFAKGLPPELLTKGMIQHPGIPHSIFQIYQQQQQQQLAAKMEEKKSHKIRQPKEMISPGIAHQPSSMIPASSQSSNPQIKSPALAQTAPSPHPVFSQPSTSQTPSNSPGHKKMNEKMLPNQWTNENPVDARNEAQRSRPTSVEPAPSPKHWGYSGNQQPKPAHQPNLDANSKTHQEAIRLIEQHKQQEMLRMQEHKEIQRQEIQRREEILRQQGMKSRENVPSTSANSSQQAERDRQTASVPGKPRSNHMPSHTESGPSVMDPRSLHHLQELRGGPRGPGAFPIPGSDMLQGIPEHVYRDPAFQQRLAALRMQPHLLDPHMLPQGYPLVPHPFLPLDPQHMADARPPSRGSNQGMRTPPPRQAHQAVAKSPAIPAQNRQMPPDPPPGEGSLLSLLQRYPVMWQGTLALKNDSCAVQMHVISGYNALVQTALPQQIIEGTCQPLRIAQRMRLEAAQLEGVIKRMQYDKDYCMLLALPCGSDHDDIIFQTRQMSTGFIQYLQQKQAAGIVNVADPRTQQPAYVVHIFPPCEFSHETLGRLGFELLHQVRNLSHLLVIITTVA